MIGGRRARLAKTIALALQVIIVTSLLAFAVETLPDLTERQRLALWWFEVFTVAVFSIEYVVRLATAEKPLKFALSFSVSSICWLCCRFICNWDSTCDHCERFG